MKLLLIFIGLFNGLAMSKIYSVIHFYTFPENWTSLRNLWKVIASTILSCGVVGILWTWPLFIFGKSNFPEIIMGNYKINGYMLSILIGLLIWRLLVDKKVVYE